MTNEIKCCSLRITKKTFTLFNLKKRISDNKKNKKHNQKFSSLKISELFCHKTTDPISFHEDDVINQRKIMFKKKLLPDWILGGLKVIACQNTEKKVNIKK